MEKSKVNIKHSGKGFIIEITEAPIDQTYAVTRDELKQIVLIGQAIMKHPLCLICHRRLQPDMSSVNFKTGEWDKHGFRCRCLPKDARISVG